MKVDYSNDLQTVLPKIPPPFSWVQDSHLSEGL